VDSTLAVSGRAAAVTAPRPLPGPPVEAGARPPRRRRPV